MTTGFTSDFLQRLTTLGEVLSANILGQDEVLSEIVALLQRSFCGMRFPDRPVASMLFLGPTGVGKTETALLFTEHLFGSKDKLIRLDMSEYMTVDSIGILRGQNTSDRGLLGIYHAHSAGSGTLLFDEIEKAHPLIIDVFLQILSAGRFTLATGQIINLRNYVVVATTNIGSRMLMESRSTDREIVRRRTIQAGTTEMRPETFRRFDLHAVFNKMGFETLKEVAILHVKKCLDIINAQGHKVTADRSVVEYIQSEGYSDQFGAAWMQSAAMRVLGDAVAKGMLARGGKPIEGTIYHDARTNECYMAA